MRDTMLVGAAVALGLLGAGCQGREARSARRPVAAGVIGPHAPPRRSVAGKPDCPAQRDADPRLPGVSGAHQTAAYWRALTAERYGLDARLMSPDGIRDFNASAQAGHPQRDLRAPVDAAEIAGQLAERAAWLDDKLATGVYAPAPAVQIALATMQPPVLAPSLRVAVDVVELYCAPSQAPLHAANGVDDRIDHNRCSAARPQEAIQVLARWSSDLLLARTAYSWGFVRADAPLSPPLPDALAQRFTAGPFATATTELRGDTAAGAVVVPARARVPLADGGRAHVATRSGFGLLDAAPGQLAPAQTLTRSAMLDAAFGFLGVPYGFGGAGGGLDCSQLLMELFGGFGLRLPRFSAWQAEASSFHIDVAGAADADKLRLADASAARGAVLLHLPGHIMLYLGRDRDGTPMVLHALASYLEPCARGGETNVRVDRVQVSDLSLGRGSSKTSLLERIDRIAVLGRGPGPELAGAAVERPAAPIAPPSQRDCRRARGAAMFSSPAAPHRGAPLRAIAIADEDPGPATLVLFGPDGVRHEPSVVATGGPPFGFIATIPEPRAGRWTAVLGDGTSLYACDSIRVLARPALAAADEANAPAPVWTVLRDWSPALENLYAVFVERLFDYPPADDLTWPNLHALTRDAERNILYDHRAAGEDASLELAPDCADLPYTLRAYFAWKLGLPYGMHECGRAREGRPPRCDRARDNLMPRAELGAADDLGAFSRFVDHELRRTVHSSSGRTAPDADAADFYPVPLSREALRPGTLFADPYGHLLVVADWVPQRASGYGAMYGADAQPDGTVGRRRFWRGSFVFSPETDSGGAGFKAFRPWRHDPDAGVLQPATNDELVRRRPVAYSREQYQGDTAAFYDRVDALINPRPLDPEARLLSLVDALAEQVSRRGTSVDTGEAFMAARGFQPIDMPEGASIFLTTGPWEDYSTPSRDWRLLIAIDTVLDLVQAVQRAPAQYGIETARAQAVAAALRERLAAELAARTLSYTRSDGSRWQLSLADVVARRQALEIAYNPNDCVETRWAAPAGSDERATCAREAPAEQRARMAEYRPWFSERRRPAM